MPKDDYISKEPQKRRGGPGPAKMGMPGDKAKDFMSAIKRLAKFCSPQLPAIIVAVVFAAAGSVLTLIGPNKLKEITNLVTEGIVTGIDIPKVVEICVFLV
ncbi:MAG: ABC transporter ATP-binding protein, partial [Eubacteriales bacterium]